jgi:hypothetical protein
MAVTSACSAQTAANDTLIALNAVVDGSAALIATAASVQTPTGDVLLALQYAKASNDAAVKSVAEYKSSDVAAVKIALITGYWSQLAIPALGQGNATLIAAGVSSLAILVGKLLAQIRPVSAAHVVALHVAMAKAPRLFTPQGFADRRKLGSIDDKAAANAATAAKLIDGLIFKGLK